MAMTQTADSPKQVSYFKHFFNAFYDVLFDPITLFESISTGWPRQARHCLYATFWVFAIATLGTLLEGSFNRFDGTTVLAALMAGTTGIGIWILTGLTFSTIAYCFRSQGRPLVLLTLTGYATLPWLFLAPLFLLRNSIGVFGELIHLTGMMALWIWTAVLFLLALQKTYHLSMDRVLLMALVPILAATLGWAWMFEAFTSALTLLR
jgi:Yip1 domain